MKYHPIIAATCLAALSIQAEIIPIEISPEGTSAATGLSPLNEVPAVAVASAGSGNTVFTGISFDTESKTLSVSLGYGSFAGFTDLTGPATAAHIHGPAGVDGTAPPIFNFIAEMQHLPAPDSSQGGVIIGGAVLDEDQSAALLDGLYYINIHTEQNPAGEIRGQLIAMINHAPQVECPAATEVECDSPDGTAVPLVAKVFDEDGDTLVVTWSVNGTVYQTEEIVAGEDGVTMADVEFVGVYGVGQHSVEVSVNDGTSEPVSCTTSVTVTDTTAPVIDMIGTFPKVLWPPNHKMIPVRVRLHAIDCTEVHSKIVEVTSNEPVNGTGDGNTSPDWEIVGDMKVLLRAERAGPGNGRVYTIIVTSVDASGNSTMSRVRVVVPHDMGSGRTPTSQNYEHRQNDEIPVVRKPDNRSNNVNTQVRRASGVRRPVPKTADEESGDEDEAPKRVRE